MTKTKRKLEQHNKRLEDCVQVAENLPDAVAEPVLQQKTVTTNGNVTPDRGYDGLSKVIVNVPQPSGSTTLTTNGTHDITDYAQAVVAVLDPELQYKVATTNGDVTADSEYYGLRKVKVNVQPALQAKEITISEENIAEMSTITADSEFYGLSEVKITLEVPTYANEVEVY